MSDITITFTPQIREILLAQLCKDVDTWLFFNDVVPDLEKVTHHKWQGTCPFCKKRDFFHNTKTGKFICKNCFAAGDIFDIVQHEREHHMDDAVKFVLGLAEVIKRGHEEDKKRRREDRKRGGLLCLPK